MKSFEIFINEQTGELSVYGLSCGYTQRISLGLKSVVLYKEHSTYHVILYHEVNRQRNWLSFDKLGEAKKAYKKMIKNDLELVVPNDLN